MRTRPRIRPKAMNDQPLPSMIHLHAGQETSLALPSAGVSGYLWRVRILGQNELGGTEARGTEVVRARVARAPSPSTPQPIGAATQQILVLEALQAGQATIRLTLARPWERNAPPLETHEIQVTVT